MVNISSQSNSVNITVSSGVGSTNVSASPDSAMYYSKKSEEWATSNKIIDNKDYSSKYYANKAQTSANNAKVYADNAQGVLTQVQGLGTEAIEEINTTKTSAVAEIETIKTNAVNTANEANTTISTNKTNAINEINTTKNSAVSSVNTTKTSAITEINNTKTTAVNAVNTSKNEALNAIANAGVNDLANKDLSNLSATGQAKFDEKVDVDSMVEFDMKEVPCVTETYVNGTSWYRVWSDGWCEQGGKTTGESNGYLVTLLKPYRDTNYTVVCTGHHGGNTDKGWNYAHTYTTTSFKMVQVSSGNDWRACGYIA